MNLLFLSFSPSLTLNISIYPPILGIIKSNVLIALLNFVPIKYLELGFVLANFEITIFATLASQISLGFFPA